jgi:hypothetical protein
MNDHDPLAAWRANPFFLLEVTTQASRLEVERAGQRLLGLLAVGNAGAGRYATPFGAATRDADGVRQALAALRDPGERVIHELWANVAAGGAPAPREGPADGWKAAGHAFGWTGTWAR